MLFLFTWGFPNVSRLLLSSLSPVKTASYRDLIKLYLGI